MPENIEALNRATEALRQDLDSAGFPDGLFNQFDFFIKKNIEYSTNNSGVLLSKITYSELNDLIQNDNIKIGTVYEVSGCCGDEKQTLILQGQDTNKISSFGYRIVRVPISYINNFPENINLGIWNNLLEPVIDQCCIFGGKVWKNISNSVGNAIDEYFNLNEEDWELMPLEDDLFYRTIFNRINYNIENNKIVREEDDRGNICIVPLLESGITSDMSDWGNEKSFNNTCTLFLNVTECFGNLITGAIANCDYVANNIGESEIIDSGYAVGNKDCNISESYEVSYNVKCVINKAKCIVSNNNNCNFEEIGLNYELQDNINQTLITLEDASSYSLIKGYRNNSEIHNIVDLNYIGMDFNTVYNFFPYINSFIHSVVVKTLNDDVIPLPNGFFLSIRINGNGLINDIDKEQIVSGYVNNNLSITDRFGLMELYDDKGTEFTNSGQKLKIIIKYC